MIYVAWWTGKGYQTIWIVLASAIMFELVRAALKLPDGMWVFGLALLGAAVANWFVGRKANRKSLAKVRTHRIKERLLYRARHKFMSLPMETFSVVLATAGIGVLVAGVLVLPVVAQDTCLDGGGAWHEGRCVH